MAFAVDASLGRHGASDESRRWRDGGGDTVAYGSQCAGFDTRGTGAHRQPSRRERGQPWRSMYAAASARHRISRSALQAISFFFYSIFHIIKEKFIILKSFISINQYVLTNQINHFGII